VAAALVDGKREQARRSALARLVILFSYIVFNVYSALDQQS